MVPEVNSEPDCGHPSASPLDQLVELRVQVLIELAVSNPPSLMTLLVCGVRQMHVPLLEQAKVPAGQSPTTPHCLHVLLTQVGVDPPHVPQT